VRKSERDGKGEKGERDREKVGEIEWGRR